MAVNHICRKSLSPVRLGIAVFVLLGACAPLDTYYKPGASVAAANRQTLACEVEALAKAPRATRVVQAPPQFLPPRRTCDKEGNCLTVPGYYAPGARYTIDPNSGLRARVERQCMADAGFAPVSIPACPSSVANAAPARATTTLPPLNENSCAIRNPDGSFQIVTRG